VCRRAWGIVGGFALTLTLNACVDAPITPDQLEPNGELRAASLGQVAFSTHSRPSPQTAARVSAVLAAQPSGPLQDAGVFGGDVGMVHLHLRADGLSDDRPVTVRWTHDGVALALPAELSQTGAMSLASSIPITPERTGKWRVEVLGIPADGTEPPVLFEREFEVVSPVVSPAVSPAVSPLGASEAAEDSEPSESETPT
jgi:hypothetical protein